MESCGWSCRSSRAPSSCWPSRSRSWPSSASSTARWWAMAQWDFKKLVAYSSVNHMGYVTLGICAAVAGRRSAGERPGLAGGRGQPRVRARSGSRRRDPADVHARHHHGRALPPDRPHLRQPHAQSATSASSAAGSGARCRSTARCSSWLPSPASACPGLAGFVSEFLVFNGSFRVGIAGNLPLLVLTALSVLGILFTAAFILWKIIQMLLLGRRTSAGSKRRTWTAARWACSCPCSSS